MYGRPVMKKSVSRPASAKKHTSHRTGGAAARRRRPSPPKRDDKLFKALLLKSLAAFEESFRRQYPYESRADILDRMTRHLSELTQFEHRHPKRSYRFGRHH